MRKQNKLYHDTTPTGGIASGWRSWGENVGYAFSSKQIFQAWLKSPGHRRNIRGRWTHMGVGYAKGDDGKMWFCVKFARYTRRIRGC